MSKAKIQICLVLEEFGVHVLPEVDKDPVYNQSNFKGRDFLTAEESNF